MAIEQNKSYVPRPIDIGTVEIKGEIEDLLEALARNAHDVWAQKRFEDGWTWGTRRCDESKTHPCLVAYEDLEEPDKDYDRILVRTTLCTIMALGYRVSKDA